MNESITYLALNIFTLFWPVVLSFDKKVHFVSKWKAAIVAIIPTAAFFIIWDHYFEKWGVWMFNDDYTIGIKLLNLPVEEWLFFFTVPFACIFIFEVVKKWINLRRFQKPALWAFRIIIPVSAGVTFYFWEEAYTSFNFLLLTIFLIYFSFSWVKTFAAEFLVAYLIHLIPFAAINGVLTSLPVVIYNNSENMALRIGSIPVEDFFYSMLLFGINVVIYQGMVGYFGGNKDHSLGDNF